MSDKPTQPVTVACPICSTTSSARREGTPYWMCHGCGAWWQDPMPPKLWHAAHEGDPAQMSETDKRINEQLAEWLLRETMGGKPGPTLDVGAAYPYLAYSLSRHGCAAVGMDGFVVEHDLGTPVINRDFESAEQDTIGKRQALITFIHAFEHIYDPLAAIRKLRGWLADDGALFIRMPDNQVEGIERDMTPGHYQIHPFVHALSSIAELCAQTGVFRIERTYELKPGQRDMVLRPI